LGGKKILWGEMRTPSKKRRRSTLVENSGEGPHRLANNLWKNEVRIT